MRKLPTGFQFSQWDGSQRLPLDPDEIMAAIADDLIEYGDLRWAMRNLMSKGMQIPQGGHMQGLRDMLKQLRDKKREQLERYDLSSIFEDFRERLDEILQMERDRIDEWLSGDGSDTSENATPDGGHAQPAQDQPQSPAESGANSDSGINESFSSDVLKNIAQNNREQLDNLPADVASQIKTLEKYEFLNPDAQRKFLELLNELRRAMANSFFNDIENMVNKMSDGDIERMKDMVQALNEMLVKKIAGEDPGFEEFMDKFGDMFGDNPPQSLDELLEQMQQQMAAAQSLLNSLSPEQQAQLSSLLSDRFGDPELNAEMAKLAKELDFLSPDGGQYRFRGDQRIDLEAAMELMNEMQDIDELMSQLQEAERGGDAGRIDKDLLKDLLGDDAAEDLDQLQELLKALEEAGYIRSDGSDRWELTPRGSRMIGQKALGEIYQRLKRQNMGNHAVPEEGRFGERLEQTKPYEFGDPFHLHMPRTIRNAIDRNGPSTPVQLKPDDFEIYRSELITSTATAMLVDLSWSMALRGSFQAAKKVALALHNLITSQYPKDSFYIIGFAAYAKELKAHDLPYLQWDEYVLGTNMQHALLLAEKLLAKHQAGSKQIIMISDGEPTAHLENGKAQFAYPPTPETIAATFKAVKHCTARGVAINTFMLDSSYYLKAFMDEIAKINGGRVFYTSPEKLGEYILVDYVQNKKKRLARRA
ncbi:MAG: VWA domain-containing protein [Gammaproteobacteria bacterium]|nr:VWA domain-containing protein [Gammaproteobacteria bacterium]|tara:strand:- start:8544 stop:10652 length:2109 start_codon:yes stop_codon:yes gene_type:complete